VPLKAKGTSGYGSCFDVRIWRLTEIPRPRPDGVEVEVGDVDVSRLWTGLARVWRAAVINLVAAAVGQGEGVAPIAD